MIVWRDIAASTKKCTYGALARQVARLLSENDSVIQNRSVPSDTVLPHVTYRDVSEAIAWLARVFGFCEHYRYGEPVSGAQIYLGNAWIQLRLAGCGRATPAQLGAGTQSLTIFIPEVDTHFKHAKAEGAKVVEEPHETVYGEWQYAAEDIDGHHWLFSSHFRDVHPGEWGAVCCETS